MSALVNREAILEGDFLVQDNSHNTATLKAAKRNSHVNLGLDQENQVVLQYSPVKSSRSQKDDQIVIFQEGKWLAFFSQSTTVSIALARVDCLQDSLVVEAKYENKTMLYDTEQRLRKALKVISYDVTIRQTHSDEMTSSPGTVHIFPDKVLVTQGFPPELSLVLAYNLEDWNSDNIKLVSDGFWFSTKPDICISSEHRDIIWSTLGQCVKQLKKDHTIVNKPTRKPKHAVYQNVQRPCCYIYMNVRDKGQGSYMNMSHITESIYINWKKQTFQDKSKEEDPPPLPPRRPQPQLPPRPRNRPPNSPLPPIPGGGSPWCGGQLDMREMQFVVYCSKPLVNHFWVIQVIFMRKNDDITLNRIKRLEEESQYQLLKPLPEQIKVTGDLQISIELSRGNACCLRSDSRQTVAYEVVKDVTLQSYWMIIEFHLEHMGMEGRSFHGKIMMTPKLDINSPIVAKKDVLISANFKDDTPANGFTHHQQAPSCDSFKSLGVKKYFELCSSLDIHSALGKDWMGLAGEVGLTVDQVFKIQSKALFPTFSPTNEVLSIWSQQHDSTCSIYELKQALGRLQRFDIMQSVLDGID